MELAPIFPGQPFQASPAQTSDLAIVVAPEIEYQVTFVQSANVPILAALPQYWARFRPAARAQYSAVPFPYNDNYEVYVDIQVSTLEEHTTFDSATVYINISNVGGECYSAFSGLFFDADALTRWALASYEERWFADNDTVDARWASSGYAERWFTDEDAVDTRWAVIGLSSENTGC